MRQLAITIAIVLLGSAMETRAFYVVPPLRPAFLVSSRTSSTTMIVVHATESASSTTTNSFIQTELRGAAMRLHTREQSPKEGQVEVPTPATPYVPTHADYLAFLVDSQHVYQAMEDMVNAREELVAFRNTGLERTLALEQDICFLMAEFGLERPSVGPPGRTYADALRQMQSIPEFMCHYYNHYFAHTAGGRMIGKQMSALLLGGRTLEFYKVSKICREKLTVGCELLLLVARGVVSYLWYCTVVRSTNVSSDPS